jgi:thiopeptide-type bacteriocin biosynthesis protein
MDDIERIFQADSDAVVDLAALVESPAFRWQLALLGVHQLLIDLGLTDAEREALVSGVGNNLCHEFAVDAKTMGSISERYRKLRSTLERLLAGTMDSPIGAQAQDALARRAEVIRDVAVKLRAIEAAGQLTVTFSEIAASLSHMHVNRLLPTSQRAYELTIMQYLARLYGSARARSAENR